MRTSWRLAFVFPLLVFLLLVQTSIVKAEDDQENPFNSQDSDNGSKNQPVTTTPQSLPPAPTPTPSTSKNKKSKQRKYFVPDPERSDAGIFNVAIAAGGNFYIEPQVDAATLLANGNYFMDFGFQGGVFFDYDYSQMPENIPLALRGMIGYKYILSSVHVFDVDLAARYMLRVSDKSEFGIGPGISAAVWYRAITSTSNTEQVLFLPSFLLDLGFDFNPFMTDFKWVINRIGASSTIMGFELYFGFRL
jgi:hypothetical protein